MAYGRLAEVIVQEKQKLDVILDELNNLPEVIEARRLEKQNAKRLQSLETQTALAEGKRRRELAEVRERVREVLAE